MTKTTTPRYYVRIDRKDDHLDGTRTYKGPLSGPRAHREADAWRQSFPAYHVAIIYAPEAVADVRKWSKATRDGSYYFIEKGEEK